MADFETLFYNIQSLSDMHQTLEKKINQKITQEKKTGKPIVTRPYEDYVRNINTICGKLEGVFERHSDKLTEIENALEIEKILEEGRRSGKISGGVRSRSRSRSPIRRR
jgi:hypothetical protein